MALLPALVPPWLLALAGSRSAEGLALRKSASFTLCGRAAADLVLLIGGDCSFDGRGDLVSGTRNAFARGTSTLDAIIVPPGEYAHGESYGVRRCCWRGLSGGVLGLVSSWLRLSQDARFAKTVANSSGSLPPRYGGMRMSSRLRNSPFDAGAGSASFAQCPALSRDSRSGVVLRRAPKLHRAVGGGISYAASTSARVPMAMALCCPCGAASQRFRFACHVQSSSRRLAAQCSLRRENLQLHVAGARLCRRRPWTWKRARSLNVEPPCPDAPDAKLAKKSVNESGFHVTRSNVVLKILAYS